MEQGLVPASWMDRRLAILEKDAERMAAYEEPNYQWNFRISPTCPPTTAFNMRGGMVWGDPEGWDGAAWYVESESFDLSDPTDTAYTYTFVNPYYYKPLAVMLLWSGNPDEVLSHPLYVTTAAEQATAALAEEAIYPAWPGGVIGPDAYYGIPIGIFILRNNGNISEPYQYMAIDRVNRGRSYIWKQPKLRFQW